MKLKRKPYIYSAFIISILTTLIILLTGCVETLPVITTECTPQKDFIFQTASDQNNKTIYLLSTNYGEVQIPDTVFNNAQTYEWEKICYTLTDNENPTYFQAIVATSTPEPIIEIQIEYVDVIVEVITEVPIEVPVYTHDLIDPEIWVALNHPVYYYYTEQEHVHLVYTDVTTSDMYMIAIVFDTNTIFSDQVQVASITYFSFGVTQGFRTLSISLEDTPFNTIEEFVEDYINQHTLEDIRTLYETVD